MCELLHTSLVVQECFVGDGWPSQTMCVDCVGCSGDLLPPSPPAEKATARQEQAGKASTGDGGGDTTGNRRIVVGLKATPRRAVESASSIIRGAVIFWTTDVNGRQKRRSELRVNG
jgi:hypothetical protein